MTFGILLLTSISFSTQAVASVRASPSPLAVLNMNECRAIAEPMERLACFDKTVAALDNAITRNDIYIADKKQVIVARRSLFGLPLHDLWFHEGDDKDEIRQIDVVIASAKQDADGNWRCRMTDGTTWLQSDEITLGRAPHAGSKAVIRRAAFGSFKMSLDGQAGVRAHREF